ncbi:MAG: hypothetical protein ABIF17_03050 [Patescibacteria group bacterium]
MFYTKNLRENEDVVLAVKKNSLAYIGNYIICFILYFVPFFFLTFLFERGMFGRAGFFVLVIIASLYFLRLLAFMYFNCLVITTQRIVNFGYQRFLTKKVIELDIEDIIGVEHTLKGIFANLFNVGSLEISWTISDKEKLLVTKFVKDPAKVQRIILDLVKLSIKDAANENAPIFKKESYQETLVRIKKDIGYATLLKLVKSLGKSEDKENFEQDIDQELDVAKEAVDE